MKYSLSGLLFVPALAQASEAATETTGKQLDLATTLGSLLFVIVFILVLAWLLKRMKVPNLVNQKGLCVVRQLPVGAKERIMIIQAGDEQYLVGVTTQSIQLISKLDKPLTQEELESSSFSTQFSQLFKKNDQT
ncbi:flagellar biosynthetic protein FliO [Vibrio sp. S4M6]|uniref:flagellar biosynthetic protein FliO n=1 Tax=Vibrio sinus TaxID=2946865 RepID=UPI00202A9026|nr:flagellar biosynthetic protein FliO [Vibrio sinus]MCL9781883.1 flagellar biosynthetic protein FliO [Vibrio sinus]